MVDYYHCTGFVAGRAIVRSGFRNSPTKDDQSGYYEEFAEKFPMKEVLSVRDLWSEKDDTLYIEATSKLWRKKFGHGTVIWVSEEPDSAYGEYCFRFKPPKGTIIVQVSGENDYYLAWVPMKTVPSKYFELLSFE